MQRPDYNLIFAGHDDGAVMAQIATVRYEQYRKDMEDRDLWTSTRANIVDRLARVCAEYEYYHPLVIKEGPVKKGKTGGQFANMRWSFVQKMSERISSYEDQLMISPKSAKEEGKRAGAGQVPAGASKYLNRAQSH